MKILRPGPSGFSVLTFAAIFILATGLPVENLMAETAWKTQVIESAGSTGWFTSLALHPVTNYPCISYLDFTHGSLKYISYDGTSWTSETVDTSGGVEGPCRS